MMMKEGAHDNDDGVPPGIKSNGDGEMRRVNPLEMEMEEEEEEYTSLMYETECGLEEGWVSQLTRRATHRRVVDAVSNQRSSIASHFLSNARRHIITGSYKIRNILMMTMLAGLVFLFVTNMNRTVTAFEESLEEQQEGIHQSNFGGVHNIGHPGGAVAHEQEQQQHKNNNHKNGPPQSTGHHVNAVPSLSTENRDNHNGHYWHDPFQSPFASHQYANRSEEELRQEQEDFETKMAFIQQKWGAWNLTDPYKVSSYDGFEYRDVPFVDMDDYVWQKDEAHVEAFLQQAKMLIHRVKEGIYAEYGHATTTSSDKKATIQERDALFQVLIQSNNNDTDKNKPIVVMNQAGHALDTIIVEQQQQQERRRLPGLAYLHQNAWDALIHKLLHAMMTNDDFYVVLLASDNAAAAGHANNFLQSSIMSFHYLMEPIFKILGMTLTSRNMASSEQSIVWNALGGKDIYGEADILLFVSSSTTEDEKSHAAGETDLLFKQAILAGERVPLLLTSEPTNDIIRRETNHEQAWIGNLRPGADMCDVTTDAEGHGLVPSCKHVRCDPKHPEFCEKNQYNSVCWVPQIDVDPPTKQKQHVGDRDKGYPGYNTHKLEGRKLSMLLLHALDAALDKWTEGIADDGFPLQEKYWHIGDVYETIRESLRTPPPAADVPASSASPPEHERRVDVLPSTTPCEELFAKYPRVCHVAMHAYTEWTPRVTPELSGLRNVLKPDMDVQANITANLYDGIDLLPLEWKIADTDVDVHAIAIATYAPPPETNEFGLYHDDDMYWASDDGSEYGYDDGGERKLLTVMVESLWKKGTNGLSRLRKAWSYSNWKLRKKSSPSSSHQRKMKREDTIVPGKGWMLYNAKAGFCDGSSQSNCDRAPENDCLMAGFNEGQAGLLGDALSGWLILQIPNVKHGIILARLDISAEPNSNERTQGWTEVNQGGGGGGEAENGRTRGMAIPETDFEFDYAINGKVTTLTRDEFMDYANDNIVDGLSLWPLLLDEEMSKGQSETSEGQTMEVAMRIRSNGGRDATILLSHVYYA